MSALTNAGIPQLDEGTKFVLLERRRALLIELAAIEKACGVENKIEGMKRRIEELERQTGNYRSR